jgi:hypothetical protein
LFPSRQALLLYQAILQKGWTHKRRTTVFTNLTLIVERCVINLQRNNGGSLLVFSINNTVCYSMSDIVLKVMWNTYTITSILRSKGQRGITCTWFYKNIIVVFCKDRNITAVENIVISIVTFLIWVNFEYLNKIQKEKYKEYFFFTLKCDS